MASTLEGRFDCHSLPAAADLPPGCRRVGIQEGQEVRQDAPLEGQGEIQLRFSLQVDIEAGSGAAIFRGKFVQGPRAEPFVYLTWGDWTAGAWVQTGRSKILLNGIPRELLLRRLAEGGTLVARICMRDGKGRPALASLKAGQVEWVD